MDGAIVGLLASILIVMIGGFGSLWYKVGKAEGALNEHLRRH